jgi:GT2 family glycosyltransferase
MLVDMRSEGLFPDLVSTPPPNAGAETRMRVAVGIITSGRRAVLSETLREIARQTRLPDAVIICPVDSDDVDHELLHSLPFSSRVIASAPGTSHQRNAILRATKGLDAIVFFDDDYFPSPSYLANAVAILERNRDVAAVTGTLIEDGINGPGLTPEQARERIAGAPTPIQAGSIQPTYGAYGCNMVFRLATVYAHNVSFDENLPLYAWQEDIDFSRQMASWGRVVRAEALTGVHLGVKRGRASGVRFGYSQVANPIFLMRKGTVSLSFGGRTMVKNLLANVGRSLRPEAYVDRVGRLKGNKIALHDLLRGRLHPGRTLEL